MTKELKPNTFLQCREDLEQIIPAEGPGQSGDEELQAIKAVLDDGSYTLGPFVKQFEEEFEAFSSGIAGATSPPSVAQGSRSSAVAAAAPARVAQGSREDSDTALATARAAPAANTAPSWSTSSTK